MYIVRYLKMVLAQGPDNIREALSQVPANRRPAWTDQLKQFTDVLVWTATTATCRGPAHPYTVASASPSAFRASRGHLGVWPDSTTMPNGF